VSERCGIDDHAHARIQCFVEEANERRLIVRLLEAQRDTVWSFGTEA
jgi:hypothetical protein